ncbi:MAG TPA: hypothetical protein VMZ29_00055 [Candidatus Bathyarchaeia archaeon]|nr:hypothetical protein [Candidatus Bathyarchaeia archaeon]
MPTVNMMRSEALAWATEIFHKSRERQATLIPVDAREEVLIQIKVLEVIEKLDRYYE